jgi:hypothetical protein
MNTAVKVARAVLVGSGALVVVLGLIIWTGNADGLIGIHELLAYVLILSLWTIAAIAARSGVSWRLVALAVAWSVGAAVLGGYQEELVNGSWHWTIQVLHLVVGMGVIASGQFLVIVMNRQADARAAMMSTRAEGSRSSAA